MTTLRLGGPARRVVTPTTEDELVTAVRDAEAGGEPVLVLAGGSNVVISDEGWGGTVVRVVTRGVEMRRSDDGRVRVDVAAGEDWDQLVARLVSDGLAGVECLAGIPGSVGATPIQNVGAYGQEIAASLSAVRVLDRVTGEVGELAPEACGLTYRSSAFKRSSRHVVLAVSFSFARSPRSLPIAYPELARALGVQTGDQVPLAAAREAVLDLRRGKGMVLDAGDHDTWSAGSFFTNPVLEPEAFAALEARVRERLGADARPPRYPAANGALKTSAAWLIESCGFAKGDSRGAVGLSRKHALALTNRGGGTSRELLAFAREIASGVQAAFGVALEPEPVLVGLDWALATPRRRAQDDDDPRLIGGDGGRSKPESRWGPFSGSASALSRNVCPSWWRPSASISRTPDADPLSGGFSQICGPALAAVVDRSPHGLDRRRRPRPRRPRRPLPRRVHRDRRAARLV